MTASPPTGRGPWLEGALLFLSLLLLYGAGACRTIYVGDSGELVTAAALLGIPHPTGYPLYILLGKLWTLLLPLGSVAFRMSLMSAMCAAVACALLYVLACRRGLGRLAATLSASTLALSSSFWSQANVQRVYSLNALLLVAALTCAWEWYESRRTGWLVATLFVAGLGGTNHTFMVVFGLAFGLFALLEEPALLRRPRPLLAAALAAVVGSTPYLYLPLRSRADPPLDWSNPESLAALWGVLTREDFWQRRWLEGFGDLTVILADYAGSFAVELTPLGGLLMVVGLLAARRHRWPLALLLLVLAGNLFSMASHGSRSDLFIWHRYYIPSYVVGALLAGLGLRTLQELRPPVSRRIAVLGLAAPLLLLVTGYGDFDRSRYRIAEDFSRLVLRDLPPGAHLAASDDNILFVLLYLHYVEGVRPDVDLIQQGVAEASLPPLKFDPDRGGLFFTHHPNWQNEALELAPVGLVFRVVRSGAPWPAPSDLPRYLEGELDGRVPKDYLTRNLIGQYHYMLGLTYERRDWIRARAELELAALWAADNDVLFYNLGLIYRRNGLHDRALAAFLRSYEINPRHLASGSRPRAADRVAEVERELTRLRALERELVTSESLRGAPGDGEYHRRMALALERRGEDLAARGHRLRAVEAAAGDGGQPPAEVDGPAGRS